MTPARLLPGYAFQPSPNQSYRTAGEPTLLVVHYTGALSGAGSLRWLRMVESEVSAHFFIDRGGQTTQLVPLDKVAWHAGPSEWHGRRHVNNFSIGVELANCGLLIAPEREGEPFLVASGRSSVRYHGPAPIEATHALGVHGHWEPYSDEQIAALGRLVDDLAAAGYSLEMAGHDEVALPQGRKIDPGPALPWGRFDGHRHAPR
jgi:N-acetylmuramoyl-L-alanine amidase